MRSLVTCHLLGVLLTACTSGSGPTIAVDVRSDWVPGVEVGSVSVRLDEGPPSRTPLWEDTDLVEGIRAATFELARPGTYVIHVALHDPPGDVVGERSAVVQAADSALGITVVITRSCAGVACPQDETCSSGQCVAPECTSLSPDACSPRCSTDEDCPTPGAACARRVCSAGECFAVPRNGECGEAQYCQPERGCLPRAGPPLDAGVQDAGPEQNDAAMDAESPDARTLDSAPEDSTAEDVQPLDASIDVPEASLDANEATCSVCIADFCEASRAACFDSTDLAEGGPSAGTRRSVLCAEMVACAESSGCEGDVCYCGITNPAICTSLTATGPCQSEIESAAETESVSTISDRRRDGMYAIGRANLYRDCVRGFCANPCMSQ